MTDLIIESASIFTMLFVVLDPLGNTPVFFFLTLHGDNKYRARIALRAVTIGFLILLFFTFAGDAFLKLAGISLPAFRIAGGIMLFVIAMQMIFTGNETANASPMTGNAAKTRDVSVFPLAIPLIAGPGSIACLILLMSQHHGDYLQQGLVIGNLLLILVIQYVLFRSCNTLIRIFGETLNEVITKILGVVLGAMSVQFVVDGILQIFFNA